MKKLLLAITLGSLVLSLCAVSAGASTPTLKSFAKTDAAQVQPRASLSDALAVLAIRQATLTAGDGAARDFFGYSVALNGDTALIGAPSHQVGSNAAQGAAYVFVRSGSSWSQQGGALTTSTSRQGFGYSVALAGDIALVGSPRDVVGSNIQGSAYAFVRSGSTWSQQGGALATASDGVHDFYGSSVALSGDTALVGSLTTRSAPTPTMAPPTSTSCRARSSPRSAGRSARRR